MAAMVFGCGGGGGDDDKPDSGVIVPDEADAMPDNTGSCNPVNGVQTGCEADEKCTWIVDQNEPFLGHTGCVPDGTVAEGDACTGGDADATGYDDCVAGTYCRGTCRAICTTAPDSCGAEGTCVGLNIQSEDGSLTELFGDIGGIGLCNPACDPVMQNCAPAGETPQACYYSSQSDKSSCSTPYTPGLQPDGTQQNPCDCLNCCAVGYGCHVRPGPDLDGGVCVQYCNPDPAIATATEAGCTDLEIEEPNRVCVQWNESGTVGVCLDCAIWGDTEICQPPAG